MKPPKKEFMSELHALIALYGTKVTREQLINFTSEHNVKLPAYVQKNKLGRGFYDLEPLLKSAEAYTGHTIASDSIAAEPEPEKTEEQLLDEINSRFASLDLMTYGVVNGDFRSMIVSGNPGIGKTYTLEYILEKARDSSQIMYTGVRGYVRPTGLFRLLWEHKDKGQAIMFDDADSVFADEVGLNLLKGALDTTKRRTISWRSEKKFESADGDAIPESFDFNGSIIFVSNIDFERSIASANKLAPHLEALMSRSYYLNLNLRNTRELMVRIKSVVENSDILSSLGKGVKKRDQQKIVDYIETNMGRLREMSLRTVIKLGTIFNAAGGDEENFRKMADATSLKRV